jgi:hypothetical protein
MLNLRALATRAEARRIRGVLTLRCAMADIPPRLAAALAERYRLERELGQGGMAPPSPSRRSTAYRSVREARRR